MNRNPAMNNRWTALLFIIAIFFITLTGWSIFRAAGSGSRATDRNYAVHGQRYSTVQEAYSKKTALPWSAQLTITPQALTVVLTDGNGHPVSGADGRLELGGEHGAAGIRPISLRERSAGEYIGVLPQELGENTKAVLFFRLGKTVFQKKLVIFL